MVTLPNPDELKRDVPDAGRSIVQINQGAIAAPGRALEGLGAAIGDFADKEAQAKDRFDLATARSALMKAQIETQRNLENDPDYASYEQKYKDAMSKAVNEAGAMIGNAQLRTAFATDAAPDLQRGLSEVLSMGKRKESDAGRASLLDLMDQNRALALSAPDEATRAQIIDSTRSAIEAARSKGWLSDVDAVNTRQKFTESYAKGYVNMLPPQQRLNMLENGGAGTPVEFLQPDERMALAEDAKRDILTEQARAEAAQAKQRAAFNSDFEIALRRGDKGYADIEQAYKSGMISPSDRTSYTLWLDSEGKKLADQRAALMRVDEAGSGGIPLDPASADDRKALNEHFGLVAQQWANLPAGDVLDRAVTYSIQKGMVPQALQSMVRGNLRAGSPDQQAIAAETLQRLRAANPDLLKDFSADDISRGNLIAQYVQYGAKPDEAVKIADDSLRLDKNVVEARDKDYQKVVTGNQPKVSTIDVARAKLASEFDEGWFSTAPSVAADAAAEFDAIARDEYRKTGNMEAAQTTALDMVKRQWGVTRVGDGSARLMKDAPEKFYGVPGLTPRENSDWMQKQLDDEIQKGGLFSSDPSGRVSLLPHPTRVSKDGLPIYAVVLTGEDGIPRVMTDQTGQPMAWRPDFQSSDMAKARAEAIRGEVNDARRKRAIQQLDEMGQAARGGRFGQGRSIKPETKPNAIP